MIKVIINPGDIVNGFTFVKELPTHVQPNGKRIRRFELICPHCNNNFETRYDSLMRNDTRRIRSCGCLALIAKPGAYSSNKKRFDGATKTPEYRTYLAMKQRCTNPNHNRYSAYGGRGITICDRWFTSFANFLEDMGLKPSPIYTIDRIDVNGNYEPSNCKWATPEEQQANKRSQKGKIIVDIKPGDRFGKLTVIDHAEPYYLKTGKPYRRMVARCECGDERIYKLSDLNRGVKTACTFKCKNKEFKTK